MIPAADKPISVLINLQLLICLSVFLIVREAIVEKLRPRRIVLLVPLPFLRAVRQTIRPAEHRHHAKKCCRRPGVSSKTLFCRARRELPQIYQLINHDPQHQKRFRKKLRQAIHCTKACKHNPADGAVLPYSFPCHGVQQQNHPCRGHDTGRLCILQPDITLIGKQKQYRDKDPAGRLLPKTAKFHIRHRRESAKQSGILQQCIPRNSVCDPIKTREQQTDQIIHINHMRIIRPLHAVHDSAESHIVVRLICRRKKQ